MSVELGRRLIASGAAGAPGIQAALQRHLGTGMPFIRALLELGYVTERALEEELSRSPLPVLGSVIPLPAIIDDLPRDLCRRLLAVPVRRDPRTGTLDVAAVDPFDTHIMEEFAYHVKSEVRVLRGSLAAVEDALNRIEKGEFSSTVILRKSVPPPDAAASATGQMPSDRPIPLVRRAVRDASVEVLGIRDIVESSSVDGAGDESGGPIQPLGATSIPRAPSLPTFSETAAKRDSQKKIQVARRDGTIPPTTSRGPFSPRAPAPPFPDIAGMLAAMEAATTRDEVIDCLIVGMSTVARRVGVFAVRKGSFRGIACNAELGDASAFRGIEISTDAPSVLGIAVASGFYLGPLPMTAPHERLLALLKEASEEVAAVLVRVAGRPALVLLADQLGDTLVATRRAEELGLQASEAFSRILKDTKGGRRGGS